MGNHSQVSKFPARSLFRQNQHPGSPGNWPLSCNGGIELSKWLHLGKKKLFPFRQKQKFNPLLWKFPVHGPVLHRYKGENKHLFEASD